MATTLPFPEYRPDLSDLDQAITRAVNNVIPRGDGYGPLKGIVALTGALSARCRGYFYARADDGSISIFAGTQTKLYLLNNTNFTWNDVSRAAGTYTDLSAAAQWQFAQFGSIVLAVQGNDNVQAYTLNSSSAFADLAGSPPDAAYVTVVGSFIVLSGLTANPFRVQWSALGSAIGWTAGTDQSDFQDLADGGIVRQVLGGEVGAIFQDIGVRRMTYAPGSDVIFVIEKIAKDIGLLHPYAACNVGDQIFFLSPKGFMQISTSGGLQPIGAERVDRTFLQSYDDGAPELVIMVADPKSHLVLCTFRSVASADTVFDKAFLYNILLQRWAPIDLTGEFIASLSQPGLTLEGLDAIAPGAMAVTGAADNGAGLIRITVASTATLVDANYYTLSAVGGVPNANGTFQIDVINGTTFDLLGSTFGGAYTSGGVVGGNAELMEVSWDSLSTATLPSLSVVNSAHRLGFFTGDNLEATLESAEQSGDGERLLVNGFWPLTDAPTVYGRISKRENLFAARTYTNESLMNGLGFVGMVRSTKYAGAKLRIPAGTLWTFATGVKPDAQRDGMQ